MRSLLATLLMCSVTATPALAAPQDPVRTIVKQMKEVFEPVRPSIRKVVISMHDGGENVQWVAGEARKEFPDGKRMVMVLLAPKDVKGMAYLIAERKNQPTAMWVYMPATRRVRELVPVDAYEHFLGTDFTYADLGFVRLHEQYRLLGEEKHAGVNAYKVEETVPQERAYYSRLITWVASDSLLPLQRDYYDVAGELWKTELFQQVAVIEDMPTPLQIKMEDLRQKSSTELNVSEVDYDVEIPDVVFDPDHLPKVAAHLLWQPFGTQAALKR